MEHQTSACLGSHDRDIDRAVLDVALPDAAQMVDNDSDGLSFGPGSLLKADSVPWVFRQPITEDDISIYFKDGVRYGKVNTAKAFNLWEAIHDLTDFILAAAQPEVFDARALKPVLPQIVFNALHLQFPRLLYLKRHSGMNPLLAEEDIPVTELVKLYYNLQFGGRLALKWILHATETCVYQDMLGRWDWDHWRVLKAMMTPPPLGSLRYFLENRGIAAKLSRNYYFAGRDPKEWAQQATVDASTMISVAGAAPSGNPDHGSRSCHENTNREMVLHPEVSSYCRAHPTFNPFAIHTDPFNPIDASYDNTDAILGTVPASTPIPINNPDPSAHCLAGYARGEKAFSSASLPDGDVEMTDVESEAEEIDAEEMTVRMQKLQLGSHYGQGRLSK
ncbi:hypothetical protein DFH06DRAFT_1346174 [Mycena polygramma]|nr:hypothetical protein DFH06DRAFT_1346174 [Mycena polygramma]